MILITNTLNWIRPRVEALIVFVWVMLAILMPGLLVMFCGVATTLDQVYCKLGASVPIPLKYFLPLTLEVVRPWWIAYAIILILLLVLEGIIYRKNEEITESSFLSVTTSKVIVATSLTIAVFLLAYNEMYIASALM